jgi:ribosomal protein L11 methyltransferase
LAALPTDAARSARLRCDEATARQLAERLSEALDPDDMAVSAFEDGAAWQVEIVFSSDADEADIRRLMSEFAGARAAQDLSFGTVAARDWVAASLEGLAPVDAGRFVVYGAHDRDRIAQNRIGIEIEAALAFGTGHHGTTRGCLLALDALLKRSRPRAILDVGTGSGVLAIAAARALRRRALGSDIDPLAAIAARGNARFNHAAPFVRIVHAAGLSDARLRAGAPYDLIFANILLAPLKRLARPAAALLAPGGVILLSGLLLADEASALSSYRAQGLALAARVRLQGWVTLLMRRGARKTATPRRKPGR